VLAVLAAGVLAAFLLRGRGESSLGTAPTTWPSPTASGAAPSPTTEASAAPTCESEPAGPLRQDTEFTVQDAGTTVPYSISLPDDYYTACKQYPVVYALHGRDQNNAGFLDKALSMRKAMAAGVLDQAIIVTPDSFGTGRWENRDNGPAEDNFIKYLIPHVEEQYRVEPGPSYRLLVGFSMGGHGAIRFGLKYPETFAAVWSVDGAMAPDSESYMPFIEGRTSADFHIISVGGQLNGHRVQGLVEALKERGVDIPYVYQDREHEFAAFVDEDEKAAGWYAMKYLQQNLGRPM
jgi:enterochelin esterase-like enzyme